MRLPSETSTQLIRNSIEGFWAQETSAGVQDFSKAAGLPEKAVEVSDKINVFLHIQELANEDGRYVFKEFLE
jgi:hypothetical protein